MMKPLTQPFRVTSEVPHFPFGWPGKVCYFVLGPPREGTDPGQIRTRDELRDAVRAALRSEVDLYAVWPGAYRSDLFWVDNPSVLAEKIGA